MATQPTGRVVGLVVAEGDLDEREIEAMLAPTGTHVVFISAMFSALQRGRGCACPDGGVVSAWLDQARRNADERRRFLDEFGALTPRESPRARSKSANRRSLAQRWRSEGRILGSRCKASSFTLAFSSIQRPGSRSRASGVCSNRSRGLCAREAGSWPFGGTTPSTLSGFAGRSTSWIRIQRQSCWLPEPKRQIGNRRAPARWHLRCHQLAEHWPMRHRSIAGQPVISSHGLTRTTSGRSSSIALRRRLSLLHHLPQGGRAAGPLRWRRQCGGRVRNDLPHCRFADLDHPTAACFS